MLSNNGSIPILPKRLNNLDKFSQSLDIDIENGRKVIKWRSQPRLKRYLELCASNNSEFARLLCQQDGENGVAILLVDIAVNNPQPLADWEPVHRKLLAQQCLGAYLEEQCYWAAIEIWKKYREHSWEEYLSMTRIFVYDEDNILGVLGKYNPHKGTMIKTYVKQALIDAIKNEANVGKFSDWRLLCTKSDEKLSEALSTAGYGEPQISYFLFVRKEFKKVYLINLGLDPSRTPGDKWPKPNELIFAETAEICNADKETSKIHEVRTGLPNLDGKEVVKWMRNCINALWNHSNLIKNYYSLEAYQENSGEIPDEQSDDEILSSDSDIESKSLKEESEGAFRETIKAITLRVEENIQKNKLPSSYRKMPILYYGVGLTHTNLVEIFGVNQSNISRHLLNYYEKPLMECLAVLKQPDWVKPYVLEWLKKHYGSPLHSDLIQAALVEAIALLESQHQEVLRLRYGEKMSSQQIAQRQCIIESEVDQRIDEALQGLEKALLKAIGKWRKAIVKKWLEDFYLDEIELVVKSAFSDGSTPTAEMLQDFLLRWIRSTMNISLDKKGELAKIDKLVIRLSKEQGDC